ncbi:hypothetical protein BJ165DRAFT_1494468 [Panaeolus papilionaceus]|nr:hypothetical protein BJ165DRAFT_1494468 [Panaeolus papilionaceus]
MSLYIILNTPSAFDFYAFSEATIKSLELLTPFTELRDSSSLSHNILGQVHEYINAIQSGFVAAQYGFTAADDIISLSQVMDSATSEEREEYLVGTLQLAHKAYSAAEESYQVFRNVRATMRFFMEQQVDQLRSIHSGSQSAGEKMLDLIENLRSQISVLESFAAHASALARWWDWVKIETDPRPHGHGYTPPLSFDCDSLRHRLVIQRWVLLRNQFADYTDMGRRLEDVYPRILAESRQRSSIRRQSRSVARTDIEQALRSIGGTRRRRIITPDVLDHTPPWSHEEKVRVETQAYLINIRLYIRIALSTHVQHVPRGDVRL